MNCDDFNGGYCELVDMHVPKSWCRKVCDRRWPNKLELAKNFTKALGRRAMNPTNRNEMELSVVMAICKACERYEIVNEKPKCRHKKCGCFLNIKTRWASEHCPDGKW